MRKGVKEEETSNKQREGGRIVSTNMNAGSERTYVSDNQRDACGAIMQCSNEVDVMRYSGPERREGERKGEKKGGREGYTGGHAPGQGRHGRGGGQTDGADLGEELDAAQYTVRDS